VHVGAHSESARCGSGHSLSAQYVTVRTGVGKLSPRNLAPGVAAGIGAGVGLRKTEDERIKDMKIRTISNTESLAIADVTRPNGQQVTRRARAVFRSGMWHLQPVATRDFTYSSTSLENCAEYWENDLRNDRKPWKI
jgi:hypothetical protein